MGKTEIVITVVCAVLGSSSVTTIVSALIDKYSSKNPWKQGTKYTLLCALQNEARRLIAQDNITSLEYNQFCEMYDVYKRMKGDGHADKLKKLVDKKAEESIEEGAA